MYSSFLKTIEKYGMLTPNDSVLAALSGGADSVLMLRLLCRYREQFGLEIRAAHVNHRLRGDESNRDEEFCKKLCDELSVPLFVKHENIAETAKQSGEGIEECGRRVRYDFFNDCAKGAKIATAHNLDDRMETFVMNTVRGTSLNGLCSISPVRDNIIRPLIECTKSDIVAYCEQMGYEYVTDSTNLCDIYRRNQVRHSILPYFFETNPSFAQTAVRMFDTLSAENRFIRDIAEQSLEELSLGQNNYDAKKLSALDPAVFMRVLALAVERSGGSVEARHLDMIKDIVLDGGKVNIAKNIFVECDKSILHFYKSQDKKAQDNRKTEPVSALMGENFFANKKIVLYNVNNKDNYCKKINNMLSYTLIDCDKISGEMLIRSRKEGDKITLAKRRVTKSLKKLFSEEKIPENERLSKVVISDDKGIVLVEGFGADKRVAPDDHTKNLLCIEIHPAE